MTEVLPPAPQITPAAAALDKSDRVPTDEEAREALKKIGSKVCLDSIRAMQTIGTWSTQLSAPKMSMAVGFSNLEETRLGKEYAKELMDAARGGANNPYGIEPEAELMVHGLKMMTNILAEERQILAMLMEAQKNDREAASSKKGKNAPPSIHQHVHLHSKPQTATPT